MSPKWKPRQWLTRSLALLWLIVTAGADASNTEVIADGMALGAIVIPDDPPHIIKYAAEELRQHLEKMTGARLDLYRESRIAHKNVPMILIGRTTFAKANGVTTEGLDPDGYRIRSIGDKLVILGRDHTGKPLGDRRGRTNKTYNEKLGLNAHGETGSLNGVYHFLRELGFRWYMPGDIGMVVPEGGTVDISGRDVEGAPHYTYRKLHGFDFNEDPEAAIWYKRVGFGSVRYINLNHSFTNWAEKYGKKHPEYFAVINGKSHLKTVPDKTRVVLDFTEPGVLKQVVENAGEYFAKNPDETLYPVVPNDSHRLHDESGDTLKYIVRPKYSPGWLSDLVWGFVNKVASHVYERYPGKEVGSLAYAYQFEAPTMLNEFSPNVVVMHSRKRLWFWDADYKKFVWENLREYTRLKPARQYIWEYYNLRSRDTKLEWIPFVAPRLIAEDIRRLKSYSSGEFIQAEQSQVNKKLVKPGLYHLNLYVTARALWNPDLDIDRLLDEYYGKYYGPAAASMKRFWEGLEMLWLTQPGYMDMTKPEDPSERYKKRKNAWRYYWNNVYAWPSISGLYEHLQQAKRESAGKGVYEKRVEFMYQEFMPFFTIARRQAGVDDVPVARAPYIGTGPLLDGSMDDPAWEQSPRHGMKDDILGGKTGPRISIGSINPLFTQKPP